MGGIFSGGEIVGFGVQIEKNGRDFYAEVAKCAAGGDSRKVFNYLKEAEENHIRTFEKILSSVESVKQPESYEGEYASYMKALADEHVFTKENAGCELGRKVSSDVEAIDAGIGFERDSIKFYEGMKKAVPERDHSLIDALIKEEQDHLRELGELKRIITRGE